jgi:hypothetical protein
VPEIASPAQGNPSRRHRAAFAAILALLASLAILASAQTAKAACPAEVCFPAFHVQTDANGTYVLEIPAGLIGTFKPELKGCIWHVKATFDDGSEPEELTFSDEEGLVKSHTFPPYGDYTLLIDATEGHKTNKELCPSVHIEVIVTYAEPTPEEPPKEEPPKEEPPTGGNPGPQGGGSSGGGNGSPRSPGAENGSAWRRCAGNVLARKVRCRRARQVAGVALAKLLKAGEGAARTDAGGFSCRVRAQGKRRLACRRGEKRVLAPLKSS